MTKKYSLKKKKNYLPNPIFIAALILLIGSIIFFYIVTKKPRIDLKQVDFSSNIFVEPVVSNNFEIVIVTADEKQVLIVEQDLVRDGQFKQILTALKINMNWPEVVVVADVFRLELNQNTTAVINLQVDKSKPINLSIARERDILNSIGQTLKQNGVNDFRVLINGQESEIFLKNISLISGLD